MTPAEDADGSREGQSQAWPAALTRVTGQQIRKFREKKKMTAEQLAEAVTALGMPYTRAQVTNLEAPSRHRRRTTVTVGEIIAFAFVLGVPPVMLITPVGEAEELEMVPGEHVDPWEAYRWFVGGDRYLTASELRVLLNAYERHDRAVRRYIKSQDRESSDALEALINVRAEIRGHGWGLPRLPATGQVDTVEEAEALRTVVELVERERGIS